MKAKQIIPLFVSSLICLLVIAGWILWMGYINSRTTTLEMHIAANVDEVTFFEAANPEYPIASLTPNGEELLTQVKLRNASNGSIVSQGTPSAYYFIAQANGQSSHPTKICCKVGARSEHIMLTIRGLNDWEIREP